MMKRSGSNDSRSSESCKNSHNASGNSRGGILSGENGCNNSSESSCGKGIHLRKRLKGPTDLKYSLCASRNTPMTKCCNHSVLQQNGTGGTSGGTCGHITKESACPLKYMHGSMHSHNCGLYREEDKEECSLKQQGCQHCPPKCSGRLCTTCLPCNCCNGFCYSCHISRVFDQETAVLTKSCCSQRNSVCSRRRHDNFGHCHSHDIHEGTLCQQHLVPAGIDCGSDCPMKIPHFCACMNTRLEKHQALGVNDSFKGDCVNENTSKRTAPAAESFKSMNDCWLTLNLGRPPKPVIADFKVDDIRLGLPESTLSGHPQLTQDLDLNIAAEDGSKSSIDICAPATPLSYNFERQSHESPQNKGNVKGSTNREAFGLAKHEIQGDIVILNDSDDEPLQNDVAKEDVLGIGKDELRQPRSVSLSLDQEMVEGVDAFCPVHVLPAKGSLGHGDENVESIDTQADKSATLPAIEKSSCGRAESKKMTEILTSIVGSTEHCPMTSDSCKEALHPNLPEVRPRSFRPRKKCAIDKKSLPLVELDRIDNEAHPSSANASETIWNAAYSKAVDVKSRMWESGTFCDLCRKGPSLSLGEWYAWCCGLPLNDCGCSLDIKMKLTLAMTSKKINRPKKMDGILWSGKVHKMCALWSSEVYEDGEGLQGLLDAVKRGKLLACAACKEYGATLGCRVKLCRRSFHYPCADELANKSFCRMWDGLQHPVACRGHRHVPQTCTNAKEKPPNLRKWRLRGFVSRTSQCSGSKTTSTPHQSSSLWSPAIKEHPIGPLHSPQAKLGKPSTAEKPVELSQTVIDISTDSEGEEKGVQTPGMNCTGRGSSSSLVAEQTELKDISPKENVPNKSDFGQCWLKDTSAPLYYMGTNLLCEDISCGREAVLIPCTNDIDSEPAPIVNYIIENRYLGRAKSILDSLLLDNKTSTAPTCKGCNINDIDDPNLEPSAHAALNDCQREVDTRFDWQGQSMLGRLPYDQFGRLQFGPETKDIIECNSRCPCGDDCLNKELQKGIRVPLEVFKTKERGWGVRTMEQISRGKFVVEYIGEVLTHDEAYVRGVKYDLSNLSCLFSADHPNVPAEDLLVIDGFQMSNVSRFINHSCDGNLRVYRVYAETTDLRFCRIGLYALRDIDIGEELSYDYSYVNCKETENKDYSTDPTSIRCMCGASNCRQWLWTGTSH